MTVADAGYHSGWGLAACAAAGYPVVMPDARSPAAQLRPFHTDRFAYDPTHDHYRCPHGHILTRRTTYQHLDGRQLARYRVPAACCRACPARAECGGGPAGREGADRQCA